MTWTECARYAAKFIARIATPRTKPVRIVAAHSHPKCERVYNITVENQPEYFANGILVHNCQDAQRYAKCNALRLLKEEMAAEKKPPAFAARQTKSLNPSRKF